MCLELWHSRPKVYQRWTNSWTTLLGKFHVTLLSLWSIRRWNKGDKWKNQGINQHSHCFVSWPNTILPMLLTWAEKLNVNLKCVQRGACICMFYIKEQTSLGKLSWKKNDLSSSRVFETWKKFVETDRKASHSLKFENLLFPASSYSCWDKCAHFWTALMFLKPI